MKNVVVSVVIPTHRRTARLRELLGSLERQSKRFEYEVIVVANLPEPGLKKVVESHGPRFRFLETGKLGAAIARNKGLERARGEIVLFLDDDCYLREKDFLERVHELHAIHPQAAAIGGPYELKEGAGVLDVVHFVNATREFDAAKRRFDETTSLHGGNWSFKVSKLGAKPKFDESFGASGSELDLFRRMRASGHSLVACEELSVVHRTQISLRGLVRNAFHRGVSIGRLGIDADRIRHWNSTLSNADVIDRSDLARSRRLDFSLALRDKAFKLGVATGKLMVAGTGSSLRFGEILAILVPDLASSGRKRLVEGARLAYENSSFLAKRKSPTES